ncbi:MAG: hotdog fold thioesterase [Steroidobacteraceae bacterium]|nr:hotdog fold thioesterase [Steroidobacteraceae bacterium]
MSIWFENYGLNDIAALNSDNMASHVGIEVVELGEGHLTGRMPVDHRTKQPYGLLHGGASVVLAETLGSIGAALTIDRARFLVVGQEINANHLRGVRSGWVQGVARPIHRGSRSQVWGVDISDETGRLVCVSRLTLAVIDRASLKDKDA